LFTTVAIGNEWMDQAQAVPLVAFLCLVAAVATGMATHGRFSYRVVLAVPPGSLRAVAVTVLGLAVLALLMLTITARTDFDRAVAQARTLAADAMALDEALRSAGPTAEPARTTLYRYTDGVARLLYSRHGDLGRPSPEAIEAFRAELRDQVAALQADPAVVVAASLRLETMLRSGDDLLRLSPAPGVKWCRPILVVLLSAGLGVLALLSPPRLRNAIMLTAMAGLLSLGLFFLEEMANPFRGALTVSKHIFDEALFVITD
jgi:hypothetical protein